MQEKSEGVKAADDLLASGKIDGATYEQLLEADKRFDYEATNWQGSRDVVDSRRAALAPPSPLASSVVRKAYKLYATGAIGLREYSEIERGDLLWRDEQERSRRDEGADEDVPSARPRGRSHSSVLFGACAPSDTRAPRPARRSSDGACSFFAKSPRTLPARRKTESAAALTMATAASIDPAEWDLPRTLAHPVTSELFESFVSRERASELLAFVKGLKDLRRLRDEHDRVPALAARRFYETFLDPESETCVNVSATRVLAAKRTIAGDAPIVSLADFEGASDELQGDVLFDIFARFKKSDLWREWAVPRACAAPS